LDLKDEHVDYSFVDAKVIGRGAENYITVFTLNRGTLHGVEIDMTVITYDGVVGRISEAGLNWSKAVSIIETSTSVGAYVERSGDVGVIEGVFKLKDRGLCLFSYLPQNPDIQEGDRVITSGLGSVYPAGLVIGVVEELAADEFGRTINAYIKPSADISALNNVMIITDYEQLYE
jgi:rod shape-determining protein MreC